MNLGRERFMGAMFKRERSLSFFIKHKFERTCFFRVEKAEERKIEIHVQEGTLS